MRTVVCTLLVGGLFVAGTALAQQHPRVPDGMYAAGLAYGQASQDHYKNPRARAAHASASFVHLPAPPAPSEATFHAISPMP
jgi:hypothetical protein